MMNVLLLIGRYLFFDFSHSWRQASNFPGLAAASDYLALRLPWSPSVACDSRSKHQGGRLGMRTVVTGGVVST